MCTVSFVPKQEGFYLAMNRDEKRTRVTALRPTIIDLAERRVVLPREPAGGSWIAANDRGICLALINWYRIAREPAGAIISRGEVVRALAGTSSIDQIAGGLAALKLRQLRPFRLIASVPSEKTLAEWRWNLERLSVRRHPWQPHHWFSSGFDEPRAEFERRRVCSSDQDGHPARSLAWLRRLHRSHAPARGPFSVCMHRRDAATVSYTEIAVSDRRLLMRYKSGPPCSAAPTVTKSLPICRCVPRTSTSESIARRDHRDPPPARLSRNRSRRGG
jgi:hypothetical protein